MHVYQSCMVDARIYSASQGNTAAGVPNWNVWACGILFVASLVSIPGHKEEEEDGGTSPDDSSLL